jgi:hypothetical protein
MSNAVENTEVEPGLQADQRLLDRGWLKIGAWRRRRWSSAWR